MRVACELVRPDQAVLSHLQLAKLLEQNEEDGLGDVSEVRTIIVFILKLRFPECIRIRLSRHYI